MAHDPTTSDESQQESAIFHGESIFQTKREATAARARALKVAELEKKNDAHKRLVLRMLNRKEEKKSPYLRSVT
jgi:hypothetical protein